jgi:bifunctional non-homologous end joining protein LigD
MLAQSLRAPEQIDVLRRGDWILERKLDGLRCLAIRYGAAVELWSRNRLPFTERFRLVASALASLPVDNFAIDGEIVAFDGDRTSFGLLQDPAGAAQPVYCVFDLLHLLGEDTTGLPAQDRRKLVARLLDDPPDGVRLVEQVDGDPEAALAAACGRGWEGLVAKRAGSPYRSGRSSDWRKFKCTNRQDFVLGGWTDPSGARTGFGAILVGYYESDGFHYAGRVGTGFDERLLRDLYGALKALETADSPFVEPVPAKGVHWCRPELVAEIAYGEWTRERRLRHPRFISLRPEKSPGELRRPPEDQRGR